MKAAVALRIALAPAVAVARVIERRLRTSPRIERTARRALAAVARRSRMARSFVRLRMMPLV